MLGKEIRGIGHLYRHCKNKPTKIFFMIKGNNRLNSGLAITVDGILYVLNNELHNTKTPNNHLIIELIHKYNYGYVMMFREASYGRHDDDYRRIIRFIVALPDDFDESYENFIKANKKVVQNLEHKLGSSGIYCDWCRYLYMFTGDSKNFFSWAVLAYLRGVSLYAIIEALRWNENYQQLAKMLEKGTITAYTNYGDVINLLEEQRNLRKIKRVNDTINMFNTKQKKLLREYVDNESMYHIMSKFRTLTPVKQNNFIRKMSTVEDPAEILKQMSFVSDVHFSWSKDDLMEYLKNNENLSYKLIVDKGPVVLIEVMDFDTVKRLAKNTNWCISKNKQYWNNYMSKSHIDNGTKQYVLFDFDKKEDDVRSIVGFTVNAKKGITASHDYVNNNILDGRIDMTMYFRNKFHTLVPEKESSGGIHSLLTSKGIDLSLLIPKDKMPYLWNVDDFLKFVNKQIGEDSYDILTLHDNLLAILVVNPNISKVLGAAYSTKVPREFRENEHIIFANFNSDPNSDDRIIFGIINYDEYTKEAYCSTLRNISCETVPVSFDEMLMSYELPYDIICRSSALSDKVFSAFTNYDLSGLRNLLSDSKTNALTYTSDDACEISEALRKTIFNFLTDEFIKVIYETGHTIAGLIGEHLVIDIVERIINTTRTLHDNDVTDEEFEMLFNHDSSLRPLRAEYIALCHIFKMIYENENAHTKKTINNSIIRMSRAPKFFLRLTDIIGNAKEPSTSKKTSYFSMLDTTAF